MKKTDVIILVGTLLVALLALAIIFFYRKEGEEVIIKVDGQEYGRYQLSEDQTIQIHSQNGENILRILDGKAYMESASCPNQLCIQQGAIRNNLESIVCLPNHVSIEVNGGENAETDAVAY